jgi:hypothetical protein
MQIDRQNPYEENTDLFQNVELAVYSTALHAESMNDLDVKEAMNALLRAYTFEQRGKSYRPPKLAGLQLELYEHMRAVCEWRLGRAGDAGLEFVHDHGSFIRSNPDASTVEQIVRVLRRLLDSVQTWTKAEGSNGYLQYLREFFEEMDR